MSENRQDYDPSTCSVTGMSYWTCILQRFELTSLKLIHLTLWLVIINLIFYSDYLC